MLVRKNVLNTKDVFTIPKGAQGNLICLINMEIRNLITLVPRAFLFVEVGEHFILVLLCTANVECKEICASDWLKPPTSTVLTYIHFGFLCFTFQIWLCTARSLFKVQVFIA